MTIPEAGVWLTGLGILVTLIIAILAQKNTWRLHKVSSQRDKSNPFAIYGPSTIDDLAREIIGGAADVPYQARRPHDLRYHLNDHLISKNVLLVGRRGLGKTREALELIKRKCDQFGEETAILHVISDLLDTPLRSEWVTPKRCGILFIDDVNKFLSQTGFEEIDMPFERLSRVIDFLSNHFDQLHMVFTSRDEKSRETETALNWRWGFWETYNFEKYQITGIHKVQKPGFIRASASYFGVEASQAEITRIASRWDGTGEAVISAFRYLSNTRNRNAKLSNLSFTYPGDWNKKIFQTLILPNLDKRHIFEAIALLNQYHIPPFHFLVLNIAGRASYGVFAPLFRRRMRRALEELNSWMFVYNGKIICPNAYIETIEPSPNISKHFLNALHSSWSNIAQAEQLWPYMYRVQQLSDEALIEKKVAIHFYQKLRRHNFGAGLDLLRAKLLNSAGRAQEALQLVHNDSGQLDQETALFAAHLLEDAGRSNDAIKLFEKTYSTGKDCERVAVSYGIALNKHGAYDAAARVLKKAALLNPLSSFVQLSLGRVYENAQKSDEAIKCFKRAVAFNPNSYSANHALAIFFEKQERFQEAALQFQKANKNRPDEPRVLMSIVSALFNSGNVDEARHWSRKARNIIGTDWLLLKNYAEILGYSNSQEGKELGCAIFIEIAEKTNSASGWVAVSKAYTSLQQNTEAIVAARKALEIDPDSIDAKRAFVFTVRFTEDIEAKAETLSIIKTLAEETNSAADWVAASKAYTSLQQNTEAIDAARKALEIDPDSIDAKRALALNLHYLQDTSAAVESVAVIRKIPEDQRNAEDYLTLAHSNDLLGLKKESIDNVISSISIKTTKPALDAFSSYAENLSAGEFKHYRSKLLEAVGAEENDIWALLEQGSIDPVVWKIAAWYFLDGGDKIRFFEFLKVKLDTDVAALNAITAAVEEFSDSDFKFSLSIMPLVVERSKNYKHLNFLGSLQRKFGALRDAETSYLQSLELNHQNGPAMYGLALTYRDMGKENKAIQLLKKNTHHAKSRKLLEELMR